MKEEQNYNLLRNLLIWTIIIPLVVVPIGFITIMLTRLLIKPRGIRILPTFSQCFWCGIAISLLLMTINLHYAKKEAQEDYLKDQSYQPEYAYDYDIEDKNKIVFVTAPKTEYQMKLQWAYHTYEYNQVQIKNGPNLYLIGKNDGKNRTFYISQAPDHITGTTCILQVYDPNKKYNEAYYTKTFEDYGGQKACMVELNYVEGQRKLQNDEYEDILLPGNLAGPIRNCESDCYSGQTNWAIIQTIIYLIGICAFFKAHYEAITVVNGLDKI